jgi:hypothetical protein
MANQSRLNDKVTFPRQYSNNKVCLKDMAQESNKYQGKGITGTSPTASWSPLQQNKTHPNTYHSPISPFEKIIGQSRCCSSSRYGSQVFIFVYVLH